MQCLEGIIQISHNNVGRRYILAQVNTGRKQFSVSLKQSVTGNNTGPYLASMLKSLDLAADIK